MNSSVKMRRIKLKIMQVVENRGMFHDVRSRELV